MDLAFGCHRVVFEWELFDFESFWNDTSLSIYIYNSTSLTGNMGPRDYTILLTLC